MDTLIRAGILYPVTSPPVEKGWLLLRGGRIARIGVGAPPRAGEVIDLSSHLVMPGFVKQVFDEENKGLNRDLDICYQKIARHFGVDFIVVLVVIKKRGIEMGLSLSVLNVLENKVVLKRQAVCKSSRFDDVLKAGVALAKDGGGL